MTFPGRAVRGLAIRTGNPANCAPDHTSFTLDFEPLPAGRSGYEFDADLDYGFDDYHRELHEECAPAISQGVLLNLAGAPKPRGYGELPPAVDPAELGPSIAVRVVLVKVRYHLVDTSPAPHAAAAWEVTQRLREALG
ncbi:hypothetical protein [Amycolatopsis albispora]|uniref:Uncharacterized protein n=1 Tax=Amycolatopsis albispora TaxID=1804986 RepID=A0A344L498_9PSEU|nr:hypothetical protein [Amycolatopsis albispora]AXB42872.1 hypothetical protein A4R43_10255 [Amycolatopsis albispora]